MRFHCGVSFSWRTIKKFLFPIILGLIAFFGFNFIFYKESTPLGFINTYALEEEHFDDLNNNGIDDEVEDNYNYWSSVLNLASDDEIQHKPLFNKIYWFDDNSSELGVLSSIYILLFLYCISMVFLKIITIIKNTRW